MTVYIGVRLPERHVPLVAPIGATRLTKLASMAYACHANHKRKARTMAQIKDVPTDEIAVHVNNCENIYLQVAHIMRGIETLKPDTELHELESMASQLRRVSTDAFYAAEALRKSARRLDMELEG